MMPKDRPPARRSGVIMFRRPTHTVVTLMVVLVLLTATVGCPSNPDKGGTAIEKPLANLGGKKDGISGDPTKKDGSPSDAVKKDGQAGGTKSPGAPNPKNEPGAKSGAASGCDDWSIAEPEHPTLEEKRLAELTALCTDALTESKRAAALESLEKKQPALARAVVTLLVNKEWAGRMEACTGTEKGKEGLVSLGADGRAALPGLGGGLKPAMH